MRLLTVLSLFWQCFDCGIAFLTRVKFSFEVFNTIPIDYLAVKCKSLKNENFIGIYFVKKIVRLKKWEMPFWSVLWLDSYTETLKMIGFSFWVKRHFWQSFALCLANQIAENTIDFKNEYNNRLGYLTAQSAFQLQLFFVRCIVIRSKIFVSSKILLKKSMLWNYTKIFALIIVRSYIND